MLGLFRTRGVNLDSGKPNVVAIMLNKTAGMSIAGGAMAPGTFLTFGEHQPFDCSQWEMLATGDEVLAMLRSQDQ